MCFVGTQASQRKDNFPCVWPVGQQDPARLGLLFGLPYRGAHEASDGVGSGTKPVLTQPVWSMMAAQ